VCVCVQGSDLGGGRWERHMFMGTPVLMSNGSIFFVKVDEM
jgi:hypothetical protein